MRTGIVMLASLVLLGSCSDGTGSRPDGDASGVTTRRVFDKPRRGLQAIPPHAIGTEGIGPFLLGMPLRDVLALISGGPRVQFMALPGVVDYSIVRAENAALVIGVRRRPGVAYVTAVAKDIALIGNGIGVGASEEALDEALGEPTPPAGRLRDPRLRIFKARPNVRFVVEGGVVAAITVAASERLPEPSDPQGRCENAALEEHRPLITAAARARADAEVRLGCAGAQEPVALVIDDGRVSVIAGAPARTRRLRIDTVPDLVYAGFVDVDGDATDEVVLLSVSTAGEPESRTWRADVFRAEGSRYLRVLSRAVYSVASDKAPLIAAELEDIDLLLEFTGGAGTLEAGGLLVQRRRGTVVNAAPLTPLKIPVRSPDPPAPRDSLVPLPQPEADIDAAAAIDGRSAIDAGPKPAPRPAPKPVILEPGDSPPEPPPTDEDEP